MMEKESRKQEVHRSRDAEVAVSLAQSEGEIKVSYRSIDVVMLWSSLGAIRW